MAIIQLPVNSDNSNYSFKVDLDDSTYMFRFRFNTRLDKWLMDIATEDEINLLVGIPLLPGTLLSSRFTDSRLPQGRLFIFNTVDENRECGRNDLGNDCLLLYDEAT